MNALISISIFSAIFTKKIQHSLMEYKKKSLSNLDIKKDYEEIDTRIASGWYVDDLNTPKKRIYKTKKTSFKLSKKLNF